MPLDNIMQTKHWDELFYQRAVWYKKFAWFPQRCVLSNRLLWCRFAYKGTAMWTGPGDPIFEFRWADKDQYLMAKIKGKL